MQFDVGVPSVKDVRTSCARAETEIRSASTVRIAFIVSASWPLSCGNQITLALANRRFNRKVLHVEFFAHSLA
jgi:hypothetical protein